MMLVKADLAICRSVSGVLDSARVRLSCKAKNLILVSCAIMSSFTNHKIHISFCQLSHLHMYCTAVLDKGHFCLEVAFPKIPYIDYIAAMVMLQTLSFIFFKLAIQKLHYHDSVLQGPFLQEIPFSKNIYFRNLKG